MTEKLWYQSTAKQFIPPEMFNDELAAIRARRKYVRVDAPHETGDASEPSARLGLCGLAISGGGIRSATFSFGVMQALAGEKVLKHMDYLSTVSGGGYSGSALTWALFGKTQSDEYQPFIDSFDVGVNFPIGTDNPRKPAPAQPDEKRAALLRYLREHGKYLIPGGGIGLLSAIGVLLRGIIDTLLLWVALAAAIILVVLLKFGTGPFESLVPFIAAVGVGVASGLIYSLGTYFSLGGGRRLRYRMRRAYEILAQPYLLITAVLLLIGTLRPIHAALGDWVATLSPAMVLTGAGTGLWTYLSSTSSGDGGGAKPKLPIGLIATVGSMLFIYGALLGAFSLGEFFAEQSFFQTYEWAPWLAIGVPIVYGWFSNTNYLSLHRFYRDRLMETFLPEIGRAIEGKTGPSYPANEAPISEMWDKEKPRGPYHIINTNVVLVDSLLRKQRARGGENFILSPFYCGSDSTAWRRTKEFERDNLTLATAMAISGAAANPNTGVAGKGVTRNRFVSLLMALLNLRLGYFVRHPQRGRAMWWPPNHFNPGLYELYAGFKESKPWLQLTDGGHFENLALYELIRRRLKLIVVLDGGADPSFKFSDLQTASRRVAEDFGTRIKFAENAGPGTLAYDPERGSGFPAYAGRAKSGFITAEIEYPDGKNGTLIYIKTTMVKGLSVETQGYKDANPTFPDETTADQFFGPEQFEAYRELGYVIGLSAAKEIEAHAKA